MRTEHFVLGYLGTDIKGYACIHTIDSEAKGLVERAHWVLKHRVYYLMEDRTLIPPKIFS